MAVPFFRVLGLAPGLLGSPGKAFHSPGPRFVNLCWRTFSGLAQALRREPNPACVLSARDLVAGGRSAKNRMV